MFQILVSSILSQLEAIISAQPSQAVLSAQFACLAEPEQNLDLSAHRDPATLRVLIVAEHASMQFGGEAALPVHYFQLLRQRGIETWLVVHERTRDELLHFFPEDADRIAFVPDTRWHRLLHSLGRYLPRKLFEITLGFAMKMLTEMYQRPVIKQLIQTQHIDVIHQPIHVSPKTPSLIFGMGVPVVIGPMNGGMTYPPGFQQPRSQLVMLVVHLGRFLSNILNILIPGKRLATTLLVANQRTRQALPFGMSGKIVELVENGVNTDLWKPKPASDKNLSEQAATRFVFMGRLVDWKAVDSLLMAFQQVLKQVPAELEIIGDGPMRGQLEQLSEELELLVPSAEPEAERRAVQFSGWLSVEQCVQRLQESDVLVLPSLFESGGAVVLEAMAVGLPVIATNWGGPVDYVDQSCGILIDPTSPDSFIDRMANAMIKLARSASLRQQMSEAGRQRVLKYYDWQKKVEMILQIYAEALDRETLLKKTQK